MTADHYFMHVSVKKTSFDNTNNNNNHRGDYVLTMSLRINSLLTDVVVLTPSDEILPSAYPSCILNSLCFSRANHLAVFKNIRANWKPPYILRD